MKKTYSYFIICRYKKGILLTSKFAFALLLAVLVQFSAYPMRDVRVPISTPVLSSDL